MGGGLQGQGGKPTDSRGLQEVVKMLQDFMSLGSKDLNSVLELYHKQQEQLFQVTDYIKKQLEKEVASISP
jgi:hypothetical protein